MRQAQFRPGITVVTGVSIRKALCLAVLFLVLPASLVLGVAGPALAQTRFAEIRDIQITGNQRVEAETVLSYLQVRTGDPFDPDRLDRSLKSLYATGLFADVTLNREGDVLVVRVVENPIINRLAFEGNRRLKDEDIEREVQLRPRTVFTRSRVQADVKRILELYRRSGRFGATVEPKVIQLPQNRVDLVFEINEGPVTKIRSIQFVGNKRYSDGDLREAIRTRESAWWRLLTSDDTYDPDRLTFDREQLRRFYLSKGYADFRVVSAIAELTPDQQAFVITFTIEEGDRYRFGKIDVQSQIRDLDPKQISEAVQTEEGDWYNAELVDKTVDRLTDAAGSFGYAFVDIRPRTRRDREARIVDLTYDVQEGPKVFVERIEIKGNVRTLDKVIRREFRLVEGDAFNTAKLRRSRQRIRNLGFFETSEVTNSPGSTPDKTVVDVKVTERSTGEINVGVGYSSSLGALIVGGITERNLLGRGQTVRLDLRAAQKRQEIDFGFTEPYFLDQNLSAGFDIFRITRNLQRQSSYSERTTGLNLRSGYEIVEYLSQRLTYGFRSIDIGDIQQNASTFIRQQEGKSSTSFVGQELTYDRRDNRLDPTEGYVVRLGTDVAGLGGDNHWFRTRLGAANYIPIFSDWTFGALASTGYIIGLDDDVRIGDRFFVGGDTFRGFRDGGIGPRDATTGDSLGGNTFAVGTLEIRAPLGLPNEFNIKAILFTEWGTAWDIDATGPGILDSNALRGSVGLGLAWPSPFGPIRVDFAVPVIKETFDKTEFFRFSFGSKF
ncbi:MAG: outer membrane protein assembly factor BamA [Alphaproteobacteria bacterium]